MDDILCVHILNIASPAPRGISSEMLPRRLNFLSGKTSRIHFKSENSK